MVGGKNNQKKQLCVLETKDCCSNKYGSQSMHSFDRTRPSQNPEFHCSDQWLCAACEADPLSLCASIRNIVRRSFVMHADRQTDRQTDRHADIETYIHERTHTLHLHTHPHTSTHTYSPSFATASSRVPRFHGCGSRVPGLEGSMVPGFKAPRTMVPSTKVPDLQASRID